MHIELTQLLTCPRCGPSHGLVAFVDHMEERRILQGRLDCPQCEARHAVRDGVVVLSGHPADVSVAGGAEAETPSAADVPDPAGVAAALLGPPEGPEVLLLLGRAGALATSIAAARPDAVLVAWAPPEPEAAGRVFPVVPPAGGTGPLPFRSSAFDGAVLTGAESRELAEAARIVKTGCRVVVLAPAGRVGDPEGASLRELAADPRAWVGTRV